MKRTPIALTIAGSDSGGGAGVQADLRTFAALGVYGASAITALTAQNTLGVRAVHVPPPEIVAAEIAAVIEDFDVRAIKIGMLASGGIVGVVAEALARFPSPLVEEGGAPKERRMRGRAERRLRSDPSSSPSGHLPPQGGKERAAFVVYDPVLAASSGDALSEAGFIDAVRKRLLPLVDCLTPNISEAAAILGEAPARDEAAMARQGAALIALGPSAVLMKGGHLDGAQAVDLLVTPGGVDRFAAPKLVSRASHGTGCTLSAAIAAYIVLGRDLADAVGEAKAFVGAAIRRGGRFRLGAGPGPLVPAPLRRR